MYKLYSIISQLYTLDLTTLIVTALVFFESLCMKLSDSTEQGKESRVLATSVLRALRFLQVVRMIRVDRRLVRPVKVNLVIYVGNIIDLEK